MGAIQPADAHERDPWTICTLTASGPIGQLELFLQAAEGPGFLDWRADFMGIEGLPLATARRLRDVYERALLQAERDPYRCALDFNRLHPIPDEIRGTGYARAGRAWMIEHWGTQWPPPWVDHRMTLRRGRQTAVFIFPSFAGTPWPLLRHLTRTKPDLRFDLDLDSTIQLGQGVALAPPPLFSAHAKFMGVAVFTLVNSRLNDVTCSA